MRQVVAGGHTIGTHTWSHMILSNKGVTPEKAKEEMASLSWVEEASEQWSGVESISVPVSRQRSAVGIPR